MPAYCVADDLSAAEGDLWSPLAPPSCLQVAKEPFGNPK
ncbi:0b014c3a-7269-4c81-90dc-8d2031996407 [Thermothielavioides terrestris]|uniref:0b014c3a-7269-4c81-90dc-8d2031996407 n=1 Tax=Thermothielavioides terrestris TaxID=2587410 RepID=A0A3S4AVZ0_9PEZI|nr:0b014c3a-7269-4c81-90dc-8d2031996407 [Thermothielavioides terrestris]